MRERKTDLKQLYTEYAGCILMGIFSPFYLFLFIFFRFFKLAKHRLGKQNTINLIIIEWREDGGS